MILSKLFQIIQTRFSRDQNWLSQPWEDGFSRPLEVGDILLASPLSFQLPKFIYPYLVQHWMVYVGYNFVLETDGFNNLYLNRLDISENYIVIDFKIKSKKERIFSRVKKLLRNKGSKLGTYSVFFQIVSIFLHR